MAVDVEHLLRKKFTIDSKLANALKRIQGRTNVRAFAFESPRYTGGCRKFFTTDLRSFYMFYRSCEAPRHFYEIVQENVPCRLYFDCEYYSRFNPDVDHRQIVDDFLRVCASTLSELLDVEVDRHKNFVILDSSTEEKFSAHVITHLPSGRLFPNNVALKPVVKLICQRLLAQNVGIIRAGDDEEDTKFICDLVVYTKNRNFRLFLSSKNRKTNVLKLADYCRFYDHSPTNAQVFLDTLVMPKDYDQFDVVDLSGLSRLLDDGEQSSGRAGAGSSGSLTAHDPMSFLSVSSWSGGTVNELRSGRPPSPFPELDDFMMAVWLRLNARTTIRMWQLIHIKSDDSRLIQYQLSNNRYCYNRGREHKSQNVYWSVDLRSFAFVQRCFDTADCYKFVSQPFPVPAPLAAELGKRVNMIFDRLIHEAVYTDSFYTSLYDRLANEILFVDNGDGKKSEEMEEKEEDGS